MPLSISLFPDIDGLDRLISDSETVLQAWLGALAILLAMVVIFECVERWRRSPIEKLLKRRF
jgi:hypothetical protein